VAAVTTTKPLELVSYFRVSTTRQGESGLGLEAQRAKVEQLAAERGAVVVAEFVIESIKSPFTVVSPSFRLLLFR